MQGRPKGRDYFDFVRCDGRAYRHDPTHSVPLKPLRTDGPATVDRRAVQFETIARLEPKGETTFKIRAQAIQPGDLRVKVQGQTDDMHQPVTTEENTRVYVDH